MKNFKPLSTPLAGHMKLSKKMCPTAREEKVNMAKVPYSSFVGRLMYAMVCIRTEIAHTVGVVSRFFKNPGKEHWKAVKWILNILEEALINACVLEHQIQSLKAIQIVIWQITLITKNALVDICLLFRGSYIMTIEVAEVCCTIYN